MNIYVWKIRFNGNRYCNRNRNLNMRFFGGKAFPGQTRQALQ
jgi:hypothetical protein